MDRALSSHIQILDYSCKKEHLEKGNLDPNNKNLHSKNYDHGTFSTGLLFRCKAWPLMLRINWPRFGLEDCRIKLHPDDLPFGKRVPFPFYSSGIPFIEYSGDPKTEHSKTGHFWYPIFEWFKPFQNRTFLSGFRMVPLAWTILCIKTIFSLSVKWSKLVNHFTCKEKIVFYI